MIKKVISGLIAGLALAMPGEARLENGTKPLLELLETGGIALRYNTSECSDGRYLGLYRHNGFKRAMILCYGATVDAEDHMVVRHEAIHAIQHCVNVARGTHILSAVINDDDELMAFTRKWLSEEAINEIKRVYDPTHWRIEFEAFAGMHAYSSEDLMVLFKKACLYSDV